MTNENGNAFRADLDGLLTPISLERPAGESLRYDPVYDQIREARREDDPTLERGIYVTELKRADWALVERLCAEALSMRSKDLQLAVWLAEAWMHEHGLAGAREGLALVRGLVEAFWDDLHPLPQDGDLDYRIAPVEWLDEKLATALRALPVTQPNVGDLSAFSLADRERAERSERQAGGRAGREERGDGAAAPVTRARFQTSLTMTPSSFLQGHHGLAGDVAGAIEALEAALREPCGDQAPRLYRLSGAVEELRRFIEQVLEEREESVEATPARPASAKAPLAGRYSIHSRDEAYRMLLEAAEYLSRVEPHSPTPFLVRRAVSWGSMTLVELMQELVHSDNDLRSIYELLGIRDRGG